LWQFNRTNLLTKLKLKTIYKIMAEVKRWYQGYKCKKNPIELVEKISQTVQEQDLSDFIRLLRLEKGAEPRKEYCFFLGIESEQAGHIPQKIIDSHLLNLPYFQFSVVPGSPSFSYEEIKPMVGVAHQVEDYTNPIPYQIAEQIQNDDPFDVSTFTEVSTLGLELSSKRYQQLLYWLSAVGSGTWELFKRACQTLELDKPQHILRKLKLLGHIETSSNGKHWSIAPTALVLIESQLENQEFILCGQQNGDLLSKLEQYCTIKSLEQHKGDAPPCVSVQFLDSSEIEQVVESIKSNLGLTINQVGNVANQLTDILPTLKNWESRLQNIQGIVPSLYNWKLFNGENFADCSLTQQTGMYQMWDMEENSCLRMTLFYNSKTDTWRQADWYGLRFLALHYSNLSCIARYDSDTARLAIPFSQRWPQLYERALVLTSGRLPSYNRTEQNLWLIYENVELDLVQKLTDKLHITYNP
jgi:hypothetical protein